MRTYYVVQKLTRTMTEEELRTIPAFANIPDNLTTVSVGPVKVDVAGRLWDCETTAVLQGPLAQYEYEMMVVDAEGNPVECEVDDDGA